MQLDSNTLIFSIGILSLLMAFISWTFPGPITERDYGLKTWSVGITFVGCSLLLTFLRSQLPPFWGVFMSNVCLMCGGTLGLLAPARFYQVSIHRGLVTLALSGGLLGLILYTFAGYPIAYAMVSVCLAMSVVMLYSVVTVYRHSSKPIPFAAHVFALSMGLMGVAYFFRAAVAAANPNVPVAPVSLSGGHQSMLIVGALFVVSSTMSFYAIVHDQQKHEIAERARRDALTGLFNRRVFFEQAEQWVKQKNAFAILMVDIDHFKTINDTYGHLGGDRVLATAGKRIAGNFRSNDISCRYGGEEFCVLLKDCGTSEAQRLAHELVALFASQPIDLPEGQQVPITVSVGVCAHQDDETLLKTLQNADLALYQAKHQGRNRARVFEG